MGHLFELLLVAVAMFAVSVLCRHRILILRHTGREDVVCEHEFLVQNVEDVPLEFAIEVELTITGKGEFEGRPELLCGYREFARRAGGGQWEDRFTSKTSFSFFPLQIRALETWVIRCNTRGGAKLTLSMYGFDPDVGRRVAYFPAIPTKLLAQDVGSSHMASAPNVALPLALFASCSAYCLSWWFPPPWTSISPVRMQTLGGFKVPDVGRWDLILLGLLILIVFWCFWPVRNEPEPIIQAYFGGNLSSVFPGPLEEKIESERTTD
jgi:hypothetical protein